MANTKSNQAPVSSRRVFGIDESALDLEESSPPVGVDQTARRTSRVSFGFLPHKPSFIGRWRANHDEETGGPSTPPSERPLIPSALAQDTEIYTTPLPTLSMVVLSIAMLGEFLSANVSAPFLLFMVEGFGEFPDEADVGFWTGILASSFFLTQFVTSLLWATVANKHGQRAVLGISLLGSAVTCFLFGTSKSMQQAIVIRLLQGIFAGAIGVARGCVTVVTDQSNEGRAYAIMGFCWGFGGVAGAIIGATFESPAKKWPSVFADVPFLSNYPYLLPCAIASSITLIGAFLSLFLGRDGGPRGGSIRLPGKETDNRPPTPILEEEVFETTPDNEHRSFGSIGRRMSSRLSDYFARRVYDAQADMPSSSSTSLPLSAPKPRTFSRTSRANGSAYGYTGSYRNRLASNNTPGARRGSVAMSIRRRKGSNVTDAPQSSVRDGGELNFAQRLLMANENAVTNISDLWVSAAMNVDNEDPFESDSESEQGESEPDSDHGLLDPEDIEIGRPTGSSITNHPRYSGLSAQRPSLGAARPEAVVPSRRPSYTGRRSSARNLSNNLGVPGDALATRRPSASGIPAIFSHSGVRTPPAVLEAQQLLSRPDDATIGESLEPIHESQHTQEPLEEVSEKPPSLYSQLPIMIIVHYGLLALHSTTHDQVFYLYLVSKYQSGGLNLNAGHFGQLIALMCFCQIAYQFYLYPNIGPPRGRFSHLAMFRLGSMLFIPAYLSVILYRAFASAEDDGDSILMAALAVSTAIRYCGSTFAYTSISVLLNYMSPPHVVGYANGIAQSMVSFSRFLGPIVGGTLWSMSVEKDPKGYPLGFLVCAGVCALAVLHSFRIR